MIASVLRESGLPVGLYTSPHLHSFRERIEVNGEPICRETFVRCVETLQPAVAEVKREFPDRELVTFDLLTAMAFLAFREAGLDAQVIEAGLGGRLDSTNALDEKEVCVITPISLEHTAILGRTIRRIASGEGGDNRAAAARRSWDSSRRRPRRSSGGPATISAPSLVEVAAGCTIERYGHTPEGQDFRLRTAGGSYDLHLPLLGRHQLENAATAVRRWRRWPAMGSTVSPEEIRRGLAEVRWPGRLEVLRRQPAARGGRRP